MKGEAFRKISSSLIRDIFFSDLFSDFYIFH